MVIPNAIRRVGHDGVALEQAGLEQIKAVAAIQHGAAVG